MPYRIVGRKNIEVENYFCDGCDVGFNDPPENIDTNKEYTLSMDFNFGYLSNRDGEQYNYKFCQNCAEEIFDYINKFSKIKKG